MQRLRSALTPWRSLLLAMLLLAAQAAGLAHRVAHGPVAGTGAAAQALWGHAAPSVRSAAAGHSADPAHAAAQDLGLAHAHDHAHDYAHADAHAHSHPASEASAECRLYDQLLGHADALIGTAPAAATPTLAEAVAPRDRACRSGTAVAAYQARAPPLA